MTSKSITVVTINYKTPEIPLQCLESVANSYISNLSIVIVDNNSGDGSADLIEQAIVKNGWQWASIIRSPVNGGFSTGNNLGIRDKDSDYYLLLNSDTVVRPGAIAIMRDTLDANPAIGMTCPRLEWEDGIPQASCFRFIRPPYELIKSSGTGVFARLLSRYVTAMPVSDDSVSPEWASFACIMIRREVFADIGFLDEKYFMYFEDTDFCYRARKAGWGILYKPMAKVAHLRGKSSPVKSLMAENRRLPRYFYESRNYYYYKIFGRKGLLTANLLWNIGWAIAIMRSVVDRKFQVPVSVKQWQDIWINFFKPDAPYIHPDTYK